MTDGVNRYFNPPVAYETFVPMDTLLRLSPIERATMCRVLGHPLIDADQHEGVALTANDFNPPNHRNFNLGFGWCASPFLYR